MEMRYLPGGKGRRPLLSPLQIKLLGYHVNAVAFLPTLQLPDIFHDTSTRSLIHKGLDKAEVINFTLIAFFCVMDSNFTVSHNGYYGRTLLY